MNHADITNTGGGSWTVKANKADFGWPVGASLAVRRTSDGSGSGMVSGGGIYLPLNSSDQEFFTGSGDRSGIQIQLKLEELSVSNASPDNYSATITYTIE